MEGRLSLQSPDSQRRPILISCLSSSWGGLEMVALEFVAELRRQGYHVIALCYENTPLEGELRRGQLPFRTLKATSSFQRILEMRRILRELNPQHLVINRLPSLKSSVPALLGLRSIRLSAISHMLVNYRKKNFYHRWLYRRLSRVVVLTKHQYENHLEYLPLERSQMAIVPDWIDEKPRASQPLDLRGFFPAKHAALPVCVTASRLDPQKGIDLAIHALRRAKDQQRPFLLAVVGENTLGERDVRSELESLAGELGVADYVRFFGYQHNISPFLASSQALLVPSYEETFGRVIVEGFAHGIPVIASRAGGPMCIIEHGRNGLLFETKSSDDLERKIAQLFANESARRAIGRAGLRDAILYSKASIFPRLLTALEIPLIRSKAALPARVANGSPPELLAD